MWEEAIILGKEVAEQYENEMFDFEQLSASLVSTLTPPTDWLNDPRSSKRMPDFLLTAETSPVLWEHSEGHPAQTGLLRRGLLRLWLPLFPAREYRLVSPQYSGVGNARVKTDDQYVY